MKSESLQIQRFILIPSVMTLLFVVGCLPQSSVKPEDVDKPLSPWIEGTVASAARMVGLRVPLSGWGILIGLEDKGSSEIPPNLAEEVRKYLRGELKLIRRRTGVPYLSVNAFMRDPDTALVKLSATAPAGAPVGTIMDIEVSAWPRTQTTSLQGGLLLPAELSVDRGVDTTQIHQKRFSTAEGMIFVNPFIDIKNPAERVKLRKGRILGGARLTRALPLRLELYNPSFSDANLIQQRINERFTGRTKVANAKSRDYIEINIPENYQRNYTRFLELILHLPIRGGAVADEARAHRIAEHMKQPDMDCNQLALIWEAMGRQALTVVQGLYSSPVPVVSYYSSRTGVRLGDYKNAGSELLRFATTKGSPFQIVAIRELGKHLYVERSGIALRKLLDDRSAIVRVAAYKSLLERGDLTSITRLAIGAMDGGEDPAFILDIVNSSREHVIYAHAFGTPRLVLFGDHMPINNPVFYETPDKNLAIFSRKAELAVAPLKEAINNDVDTDKKVDEEAETEEEKADREARKKDHIVVYRLLASGPGKPRLISKKFRIGFDVVELIRTLGSAPRYTDLDTEIRGLGVTYGQVVQILSNLCEEKSIPAKFFLQNPAEMERIQATTPVTQPKVE